MKSQRNTRPLKQIIERLNGTFKGSYRTTCGFNSSDGSVAFVTLFAAYFNFLRTHSALNQKKIFNNRLPLYSFPYHLSLPLLHPLFLLHL
ncbi:hypothetical protein BS101_11260 [Clostridium kluyveri]|uniref:Integrase catalytic domain-containing protein n=1 Tax=Clostridium kluyveri TaxID=1534 RepID=A0A1L5F8Y2_CLOKL|nr:hypothetical protein BS101_11260 [Clostridium kluyveri]